MKFLEAVCGGSEMKILNSKGASTDSIVESIFEIDSSISINFSKAILEAMFYLHG